MAAPSYTARQTPVTGTAGYHMKDGFKSLVTCALAPALNLWERTVQFGGIEMGDPIPYSTMHNGTYLTQRPRSLKQLTPLNMRCAYTGMTLANIEGLAGRETTWSQYFPSGAWCAFYGYLRSCIPQEHQEGNPPEVQVVIQPTNWDPSGLVEAGPAFGTA